MDCKVTKKNKTIGKFLFPSNYCKIEKKIHKKRKVGSIKVTSKNCFKMRNL